MQQNRLGTLFDVSALALGGGGIGQVWGDTTQEEAVATVRAWTLSMQSAEAVTPEPV